MKSVSMDASWSPVPPSRVTIVDGFWKRWRDLVGTTTLFHQFRQLQGEGQIDALALDQKMHRGRAVGDDWYWGGSIFWDSDLAKWLEAASARLEQTRDPELEKLVDDIIVRFERAQQPDGYVNSHILTWRPRHRFKNLRDLHELYCAGHLIEAAVVHHEATGKDTLLSVARRYADLFRVFLKHSDVIDRVTFWGVTDADSWLNNWPVKGRTSYPLLFDRSGRPKPAFEAVLQTKH